MKNAVVLNEPINSRMVGASETVQKRRYVLDADLWGVSRPL